MYNYYRIILFLIGCIGTRILLAWYAKIIPLQYLPIMGALALIPALGFTIIYLFGLRKTGPEVFGGTIWWNRLRPIHAFLYFLFAYLALCRKREAWKVLAVDVLIGFVAWIIYTF